MDDLSRIISLRDNAYEPAVGNHDQRSNSLVGHFFDRLIDRLIGGCRPDFAALLFQNRVDWVNESHLIYLLRIAVRSSAFAVCLVDSQKVAILAPHQKKESK